MISIIPNNNAALHCKLLHSLSAPKGSLENKSQTMTVAVWSHLMPIVSLHLSMYVNNPTCNKSVLFLLNMPLNERFHVANIGVNDRKRVKHASEK